MQNSRPSPAQQRCFKPARCALRSQGVSTVCSVRHRCHRQCLHCFMATLRWPLHWGHPNWKMGLGQSSQAVVSIPCAICELLLLCMHPAKHGARALLLILPLMLLPKQAAFRKCSLEYSSLLIITVWWVSHFNQVLQKACFNKRELWPYSHCNASIWFLQHFSLGKETLQCNKWEKNLSGNPSMKLLMKKEDFFLSVFEIICEYWTALPAKAIFCTSLH